MTTRTARVRWLGRQPYQRIWDAMRAFTDARDASTQDELWCLEHDPVFTLGQAGKPEHVLAPGDIPVVQTDRGGQVTYHGPGQLVIYPLLDLERAQLGPRPLVTALEQSMVAALAQWQIQAHTKADAPGVYVAQAKIASIGLRIRRHAAYHGLAMNVAMDLAPFARINPCGYAGLQMTQVSELGGPEQITQVARTLLPELAQRLDLQLLGLEDLPASPEN